MRVAPAGTRSALMGPLESAQPNPAVRRPPSETPKLATAGQVACLTFSLVMAALAPGWHVALVCAMTLGLGVAFYRPGLRLLLSARVWLFLALLVGPSALLLAPPDVTVAGLPFSWLGLETGLQMALRAVAIVVAVAGFSANVSVSALAGLLERAGLKGLGFSLGVAVNMLPTIQETVSNAYQALRLRGGFRRQRWQAMRLLLVTVVVNALRHADDIVSAAEARAFSVARARHQPMEWRPLDLALTIFLAMAGLVLLLA